MRAGFLLNRVAACILATMLVDATCHAEGGESRVRLHSTPPGAAIFINGEREPRPTPRAVEAGPDDHIILKLPGFLEHRVKLGQEDTLVRARLKEITQFRMKLEVKTGGAKNAGTDDARIQVHLNGDPRTARSLNNRGDDRRVGGIDRYVCEFSCATEDLQGIRIFMESGEDAWLLDYVAVRLEKKDGSSYERAQRFGKWMSCDRKEGRRYVDMAFPRARFRAKK